MFCVKQQTNNKQIADTALLIMYIKFYVQFIKVHLNASIKIVLCYCLYFYSIALSAKEIVTEGT